MLRDEVSATALEDAVAVGAARTRNVAFDAADT
jgi:hypothetical protein